MNITASFHAKEPGTVNGGSLECPVCSYQGGSIGRVDQVDSDTLVIGLACHHGHNYRLIITEIHDSMGTLSWAVKYDSEDYPE